MKSLANTLLDSSRAARSVGPNSNRSSAANASAMPRLSGNSGPTIVRSIFSRSTIRSTARESGVARRADDLGDAALRRQFPHERVLASPAADNQYFGRAHD